MPTNYKNNICFLSNLPSRLTRNERRDSRSHFTKIHNKNAALLHIIMSIMNSENAKLQDYICKRISFSKPLSIFRFGDTKLMLISKSVREAELSPVKTFPQALIFKMANLW